MRCIKSLSKVWRQRCWRPTVTLGKSFLPAVEQALYGVQLRAFADLFAEVQASRREPVLAVGSACKGRKRLIRPYLGNGFPSLLHLTEETLEVLTIFVRACVYEWSCDGTPDL